MRTGWDNTLFAFKFGLTLAQVEDIKQLCRIYFDEHNIGSLGLLLEPDNSVQLDTVLDKVILASPALNTLQASERPEARKLLRRFASDWKRNVNRRKENNHGENSPRREDCKCNACRKGWKRSKSMSEDEAEEGFYIKEKNRASSATIAKSHPAQITKDKHQTQTRDTRNDMQRPSSLPPSAPGASSTNPTSKKPGRVWSPDDSSSLASMSSGSRSKLCYRCKEPEEPLIKPLITCEICPRRFHPCCHRPMLDDWNAPLARCYVCIKQSSKPASSTKAPPAEASKGKAIFCEMRDCNRPVFATSSGSRPLCKFHAMAKRHQSALTKRPAANVAPAPKPIQKKKLYSVRPDDKQYVTENIRKRQRSLGDNDMDPAFHPVQKAPRTQGRTHASQSISESLFRASQIRNGMPITARPFGQFNGSTNAVNTKNTNPAQAASRSGSVPTESPAYKPGPLKTPKGPAEPSVSKNDGAVSLAQNAEAHHANKEESPGDQITSELRANANQHAAQNIDSDDIYSVPNSPIPIARQPLIARLGEVSARDPPEKGEVSGAKSAAQIASLLEESSLSLEVDPKPLGQENSGHTPSRPSVEQSSTVPSVLSSVPPSEQGDAEMATIIDQVTANDFLFPRSSPQPEPADFHSFLPKTAPLDQNPIVPDAHDPLGTEAPNVEVADVDMPDVDLSDAEDAACNTNPKHDEAGTLNTEPKPSSGRLWFLPDPSQEILSEKPNPKAATFDPTELDKHLIPEEEQKPLPPDILVSTQEWGAIDPRTAWPALPSQDALEAKENFLEAKRAEIAARPRRKQLFGKHLTPQIRAERKANGWDLHQQCDRKDDAEARDFIRRMEELFGIEGLGNCVPGTVRAKDGTTHFVMREREEMVNHGGMKGKKRKAKCFPVYPSALRKAGGEAGR